MPTWKELCYLWSSDFRTHITEKRWAVFQDRLREAEMFWGIPVSATSPAKKGEAIQPRHIDVDHATPDARLDRRRGLALERIKFANHAQATLGGLAHGHFDDITLQADWYTGDCVFEAPGEHKVTDLEWTETRRWTVENGDVFVKGHIETAKGPIEKTLRFAHDAPRVDFDLSFHWKDWAREAFASVTSPCFPTRSMPTILR